MLQPKRTKYRKLQKGRIRGKAMRGATLAFGSGVIVSGSATLTGSCADMHSNGDFDITGTTITSGGVSAVGQVNVGGTLKDTLGNDVTPTEGASPQTVSDYQPMDHCLDKDESGSTHFSSGKYWYAGLWRSLSQIGWTYSSGTYTTNNDSIPLPQR